MGQVPARKGEGYRVHSYTERIADLNRGTLIRIVEERATGLANAEEPKDTEVHRWIRKG